MLVWEEALGIDPENEQANSYVDYVRQSYDLLTGGDPAGDEAHAPFAIDDDEYAVEIIEGAELSPATPMRMQIDPMDEGWFIDDHHAAAALGHATEATVRATPVVELDAEEPPSFDGETREYQRGQATTRPPPGAVVAVPDDDDDDDEPEISVSTSVPADAATEFSSGGHTPGFDDSQSAHDSTPVGFAAQNTDVRARSLGFVQALKAPAAAQPATARPTTAQPAPAQPARPADPADDEPEIEVVRQDPEPDADASQPLRAAARPDPGNRFRERVRADHPRAHAAREARDEPRCTPFARRAPCLRAHADARQEIEDAIAAADILGTHAPEVSPVANTFRAAADRDRAARARAHGGRCPRGAAQPARAGDRRRDLAAVTSAATRELPLAAQMPMPMPVMADERNRTRDLSWEVGQDHLTARLPLIQQVELSAPTRRLGMRPTRGDIMSKLNVRGVQLPGDDTRADIKSPFDPIDARNTQILDDRHRRAGERDQDDRRGTGSRS